MATSHSLRPKRHPAAGSRVPRRRLTALVASSVLAGMVEAVVLALVAYIAVTIAAPAEQPFSLGLGFTLAGASTSFLLGCAAALALARLGLQVVLARQPASIAAEAQAMYRRRLLDAFLHAGWAEKSLQRDGRLQELLTTQVDRAALATLHLGMAITAGFNFGMLVLVALIMSPVVAAAIGTAAVVMFFLLRPLSARSRAQTAAHVAIHTSFAEEVSEVAALAQELETFGAANELARRQGQSIDRVSESFIPTVFLTTLVPGMYQGLALLAAVGGLAVLSGIDGADVATLGAVVLLVLRALAHSQQLQSAHQQIRQLQPYVNSLEEVERRLRSSRSGDGALKLESISHVSLHEVGFRYPDGPRALIGITAAFEAGEAIGIVGSSGAGKSTLVQILLRLRDPTEGSYEISGRPADSWNLDSWWRRVALVPQEPQLLTSTVHENIRFLRTSITDDEVEQAARHAHIHDEILSWSNGYDTIVSNRVEAVSGGQRQRLCIARALAASPELLVLDEPTSDLDGRSEALIQASLSTLKGKVTMVIVAHRLSTLALCDRIMVLNAGRLEAFDTAEVLEQTNPFFREAVRHARVGVAGGRLETGSSAVAGPTNGRLASPPNGGGT